MKKFIAALLFVSIIALSNVQPTQAHETEKSREIISKEVVHYERIYSESGELKEETILDKATYEKRVKEKKSEINKNKDMSFVADRVPEHSAAYKKFKVEEELEALSAKSLTTASTLAYASTDSSLMTTSMSTTSTSDECRYFERECLFDEVTNKEYTTHTTSMILRPNDHFGGHSVSLETNLHWDIMPKNRMTDVIALSWDHGDKVFADISTLRVDMSVDYEYYYKSGKIFHDDHTRYSYEKSKSFKYTDHMDRFQKSEYGVIFNPDLSAYEDYHKYWQNFFTMYEELEMKTYTDLDITLKVDLVTDNGNSLLNNAIYDFRAVGEYVHLWEQISDIPYFNIDINPASKYYRRLRFDTSEYSDYDGFRRNIIDVDIT